MTIGLKIQVWTREKKFDFRNVTKFLSASTFVEPQTKFDKITKYLHKTDQPQRHSQIGGNRVREKPEFSHLFSEPTLGLLENCRNVNKYIGIYEFELAKIVRINVH